MNHLAGLLSLVLFFTTSTYAQTSKNGTFYKTKTLIETRTQEIGAEPTYRIGYCYQTLRANFIDRWGFEIEEKVTQLTYIVQVVVEERGFWSGDVKVKESMIPGTDHTSYFTRTRLIQSSDDAGYNGCAAMRLLYSK